MDIPMKPTTRKPLDSNFVLACLQNFKNISVNTGTHEGRVAWSFSYFMQDPGKAS